MEGRCRHVLTAQFALHPTRIVSPSLHGAHCMRPQVEAQRLSLQDCCRRAPLAKAHPWVLLCSCGSPGCRPPHSPTAQIAVSRPPSTPHRPLLRPHARAPSICPSRASARSLVLGRFPPISPTVTCAQVPDGRQRRHEAVREAVANARVVAAPNDGALDAARGTRGSRRSPLSSRHQPGAVGNVHVNSHIFIYHGTLNSHISIMVLSTLT